MMIYIPPVMIDYPDPQLVAEETPLQTMRCTCYLPTGNPCYDGTPTHNGVISSNVEHVGMTAILYTMDGDYIGIFECHDIGGNVMLRNGTGIDVYRDTMQDAWDWVATYGDYVQVRWISPEG